MMTPRQIALVRCQFGRVGRDADRFASLFYDHLFYQDDSLRPYFPADMRPQRRRLVGALAEIILSLDRLDAVIHQVHDLGFRQIAGSAAQGLLPDHCATVGEALLAALADMLAEDFTDEAQTAWAIAYGTLAEAMMHATAERRLAA